MERRLSYTLLGLFVVILVGGLAVFMFWLMKYGDKTVSYDYYKTYFNESVSGLDIESPVKYRGVRVGSVKDIEIDKDDSEKIMVLLQIKKGTPVKKDSFVTLDSQGITGLKYIEIKGGSKNSPLLISKRGDAAVIPSKKSVLSTIFDNSENITQKISKVLDKINLLLSRKNLDDMQNIISSISSTSLYIDKNKEAIGKTLKQISLIRDDIKESLQRVTDEMVMLGKNGKNFLDITAKNENSLTLSLNVVSNSITEASKSIKVLVEDLNKKVKSGKFDMDDIVEENMQIINSTALSIKELSLKVKELTKELENSPSDILYKSRKEILGPGEN